MSVIAKTAIKPQSAAMAALKTAEENNWRYVLIVDAGNGSSIEATNIQSNIQRARVLERSARAARKSGD